MKVVWEVGDLSDTKLIKLLKQESEVLPFLQHPGIPKADLDNYFEVQTSSGQTMYCMVLEQVEGQNLLKWLDEHEPISEATALDWLRQLASILHVVHQQGVFHRDIKPDNIILKPNGELTLIDFGAMRVITDTYLLKLSMDPSERGSSSTQYETTRIYTYGYAPPEQINGRAIAQSDFFALGRTFVHLVTGIHPKHLPEDEDTAKLLWRDKAPQLSVPAADYIDKLIERSPRKRPLDSQALIHDLNELIPARIKRHRLLSNRWFRLFCLASAAAILVVGVWKGLKFTSRQFVNSGLVKLEQGNQAGAESQIRTAIKLDPSSYRAYNALAGLCFKSGQMECAFDNYRLATEHRPKATKWIEVANIGRIYDELDNTQQAIDYYQEAIKQSDGTEAYPINNLARLELLEGNVDQAKHRLMAITKQSLEPADGIVLLKNLGWAEYELGNYTEARDYLKQSIDLQLEVLKMEPEKVVNPADPYCYLMKVQEQLSAIERDTRRNCLLLETKTPEVVQMRIEYIDKASINTYRADILQKHKKLA